MTLDEMQAASINSNIGLGDIVYLREDIQLNSSRYFDPFRKCALRVTGVYGPEVRVRPTTGTGDESTSLYKVRFTKTKPPTTGFPFEVDKTTVVNTRKVKKTKTIEVEEDEPTYTVTLTKDQAEALQEIAHHFLKRHENSGRNGVQHQASKLANDTILPVYQSLSKAGLVPFALGGNSDVIKSIRSVQGAY